MMWSTEREWTAGCVWRWFVVIVARKKMPFQREEEEEEAGYCCLNFTGWWTVMGVMEVEDAVNHSELAVAAAVDGPRRALLAPTLLSSMWMRFL